MSPVPTSVPSPASAADGVSSAVSATVPVVEEQLQVVTQPVVGDTVRVVTHVAEHQETVDLPTTLQTVDVERVTLNREIDAPVGTRQEGDTLIVPVVEEVYVVQKKLILREEIRLTTRRVATTDRQSVTLRRTEVTVERRPGDGSGCSEPGTPEIPQS